MPHFTFKEFSVLQDKTAMKVGTDAVLLGAWAPIDHNPSSILDIGAGTGVIALMLAQRTFSEQIDGLEINENAYENAVDNFENSPWGDRLFCFHADLDQFIEDPEMEYDLIVSNPPFYTEDYKTESKQRDLARFQDAMPFEKLLKAADLLLSENGVFALIIPFKEKDKFLALAKESKLYPLKITSVRGNLNAPFKRSLLAFSRNEIQEIESNELTIEIERHVYTSEYIELTKEFYLKM